MFASTNVQWVELETTPSTNDFLLQSVDLGNLHCIRVVSAIEQTAGKGRQGRRWLSVPGGSLCFSVGFSVESQMMPFLPVLVGGVLAQTLRDLGFAVQVKWPNDLLVNGHKLGGVLCEAKRIHGHRYMVVGVGLNLQAPPGALALNNLPVACLEQEGFVNTQAHRSQLLINLVHALLAAIELSLTQGFAPFEKAWAQLDAWLGQSVQLEKDGVVVLQGQAGGVDSEGAYRVNTLQGMERVMVGDLSLRPVVLAQKGGGDFGNG